MTHDTTFSPAIADRETMGGGFELLNFVVANGISLGSLIVSLASCRESRRRSTGQAPPVKVRHRTTVVEVEGDGQEALRFLTEAVESAEK